MLRILPRCALLLSGVAAVLWVVVALPSFRLSVPVADVTARILADQRFKSDVLSDLLRGMTGAPLPVILQSAFTRAQALVLLVSAENSKQRASNEEVDRQNELVENTIKLSLSLSPSDSFLWLMLYSAETTRNGYDQSSLRHLNYSYDRGPYEGWIALRRSPVALSVFGSVTETVRKQVVSEFAKITDADLIDNAALILTGIGWTHREQLLAGLEQADVLSREMLNRRLAREGVKVRIPGVRVEDRPW